MIRSDAWDGKTGTHALTLKVELMHEAEKQGRQHHFLPLSRSAPAHVGAAPPTTPYPTVGPRQQGAGPFKSKFSRDNRHKKRKISPFRQLQPKIKIVSIKKSRAFRGKY